MQALLTANRRFPKGQSAGHDLSSSVSLILMFVVGFWYNSAVLLLCSPVKMVDEVTLRFLAGENQHGILVMFLAMLGSTRMAENLLHVGRDVVNCPSCSLLVVNFTSSNSTNFLVPGEFYKASSFRCLGQWYMKCCDLAAKFYAGLQYFIEETRLPWMWRGTDDVYINFSRLERYVAFLSAKYDPFEQPLVFGNCIPDSQFGVDGFIQGGSGWIVSRALAVKLFLVFPLFMDMLNSGDDIVFARVLSRLNVSVSGSASSAFLGHDLTELASVLNGSFVPPVCPTLRDIDAWQCAKFIGRLSDVVFFHETKVRKSSCMPIREDALRLQSLPGNYCFYFNASWPRICIEGRRT